MKKNNNRGVAILSIMSILFALFYTTPRFIRHYHDRQAEREWHSRMEKVRQYTEQGRQLLSEERWVEAKSQFAEAQSLDDSHAPARIGLAEALYRLESAEAALDSLNGCSHADCDKERMSLNNRAWETLKVGGIDAKNIEKAWRHAETLISPSCFAEQIIRQDLAVTTQERSGLNVVLIKLLRTQMEKTESAALKSAARAAGIPTPELGEAITNLAMLSALDRAEQLEQRGRQMGADLIHDPAFLESPACTLTDKLWDEDMQASGKMAFSSNLPFSDYASSGNSAGDLRSGVNRLDNRQEYSDQMRRLYELGTAVAMLEEIDKRCKQGCSKGKIPGPQINILSIANRLW